MLWGRVCGTNIMATFEKGLKEAVQILHKTQKEPEVHER